MSDCFRMALLNLFYNNFSVKCVNWGLNKGRGEGDIYVYYIYLFIYLWLVGLCADSRQNILGLGFKCPKHIKNYS